MPAESFANVTKSVGEELQPKLICLSEPSVLAFRILALFNIVRTVKQMEKQSHAVNTVTYF